LRPHGPKPNLRCPRNGKWTGLGFILKPGPAVCPYQPLDALWVTGKAAPVVSTSPDTGQQGGSRLPRAASRCAHALPGMVVRAYLWCFNFYEKV